MNNTTDSLKKSQASLAHEFNSVLEDAQELLRHATGEAGKGYAEARARLETSMEAARERIQAAENMVVESAREAGRSADSYVRKHPWESIAVGAGVGLLLGLLIARR